INGFILFNTMILDYQDRRRNAIYKSKFDSNYSVRLYPKIEVHNELFTIKKLS
ncbi:MAG: spermidine synthase, partial [Flavobacterium sp.]